MQNPAPPAPYPFWRVILAFTLLGGALGTVIFLLVLLPLFTGKLLSVSFLADTGFILIGSGFGTPAALLTGICFALRRLRRRNGADLFKAGVCGGLIAFSVNFLLIFLFGPQQELLSKPHFTAAGFSAGAGFFATLILTACFLPRDGSPQTVPTDNHP